MTDTERRRATNNVNTIAFAEMRERTCTKNDFRQMVEAGGIPDPTGRCLIALQAYARVFAQPEIARAAAARAELRAMDPGT